MATESMEEEQRLMVWTPETAGTNQCQAEAEVAAQRPEKPSPGLPALEPEMGVPTGMLVAVAQVDWARARGTNTSAARLPASAAKRGTRRRNNVPGIESLRDGWTDGRRRSVRR